MATDTPGTVCFVAREDFVSKPGGDTIQWQIYDAAARAAGYRTVAWFDDAPLPDADVYHALNIDRPLELYPKMKAAHRRGRPFILGTIHHPFAWSERFRRKEPPGGFAGQLFYRSPFGRSFPASESAKEFVRLIQQGRWSHLGEMWPSWRARARWLLEEASRVMLLARGEATHLVSDFRATISPHRYVVVPNWVEGVGENIPSDCPAILSGWPEPPVLVVSRIEARKNVRRLAALAEAAGRPTVFIGKPNPNEPRYVDRFVHAVKGYRFVKWIPGVTRTELAAYYRAGSFLLNGSYVEVSPMVDIEALSFGCPVVTTRNAVHHELLPADTPRCDPYSDTDLLRQFQWRPARRAPVAVVSPEECRASLLAAYGAVIAEHSSNL